MKSTTTLYNTILASDHWQEVKITIAGRDYGMSALTSLRTNRDVFGSGSPEMGLAPAGEIRLTLYADSAQIPRMAELRPYIRIRNSTQVSEWLPKGAYYLDTREADSTGLLTLCGFDAMLKAEADYPSSSLSWSALDTDVVSEIAAAMNVRLDPSLSTRMNAGFRIPLPVQYSMRETLQNIAALYGGSFILADNSRLKLICLADVKSTADLALGGASARLETSPAFPACTGVRFLVDEQTEVFAGTDSGYVYEISCPWANQDAADRLLTELQGYCYQPYRAENAIVNPAYDLGDTLDLGSGILAGVFSEEICFDSLGPVTLAAPQDEELDHEYPYQSSEQRRYSRRFREFESELTLQEQQIAAKVSRTGGSAASFGWILDAEGFDLISQNSRVFHCDEDGVEIRGKVTATSGSIGGCDIQGGVLQIQNANIGNIAAEKITTGTLNVGRIASQSLTGAKLANYTLTDTQLDDSAVVTRTLSDRAVTYGKSSYQTTLDQVGINKANIDTLYGYFTGTASFSALQAGTFWLNGYRVRAGSNVPINGTNYHLVTWGTDS